MKIEDGYGVKLAERNIRILRAELAGIGPGGDSTVEAMRASLLGQINSIEKDIKEYELWMEYVNIGQFNPE
jgi:hypothetical protein